MELKEVVSEYKKKGFVIDENNRVLCATSRMYARYSALGKIFQQERDGSGKLVKYVWTLVTKAEALKLKTLMCPEDGKAAIKFAYIPASKIPQFNTSLPTVENEVEEVEVSQDMFAKKKAVVQDIAPTDDDLDPPAGDDDDEDLDPDLDPENDGEGEGEDDETEKGFEDLEKESTQQPTTDGGLTARDVEEKELMEKDIAEVRVLCDDLGIEYKKNTTKKALVKKILG